MPVNRVWRAIGTVALFLLAISLVGHVMAALLDLVGMLIPVVAVFLSPLVRLVPLAAVFLYLDWRWGWKPESIGLPRQSRGLLWLLGGLAGGAVVWVLVWVTDALLSGKIPEWNPGSFHVGLTDIPMLLSTLLAVALIEIVFRGAVVSRLQSDLDPKEVLLIALLTPPAVTAIQVMIGLGGGLPTGIISLWQVAMSAALVLLFLRTGSTWLTIGVALSDMVVGPFVVTGDRGALLVWGAVAVLLFLLEWRNYGRLRRPPGGRRGPQRVSYGKVHRGPWGPH